VSTIIWRKLKKEDGRVVTGDRRYSEPGTKGVFIASVERPDLGSQTTVERCVVNGVELKGLIAHHGQGRHLATERAVNAFLGR
jgi:hypothetical protein